MALAAGIVVSVSMLAERARPFLAAMIATLPISAGPSLVFLAMDHDEAFMREALLGMMVANIAITGYLLAYAHLAQKRGLALSLGAALAAWVALGTALRGINWTPMIALWVSLLVYGVMMRVMARFVAVERGPTPPRSRYALPMRALAVAVLVGLVTLLSARVGPYVSAFLAAFPIVLSSLIVILHPKIGGPATASFIANSVMGLTGFGLALAAALTSLPHIGRFWALGVGLLASFAWNGMLAFNGWRRARNS
jgi:uncharacterized membrane protein (GlpM family)